MSNLLRGRLPRYECHKEVSAGRITGITFTPDGQRQLVLEQNVVVVPLAEWFARNPETAIGGYYVMYDDDYTSYSPKKPFESGYTRKDVTSIKVLPIPRG